MHEGVITSSTIDMGTASNLPKFIKELTMTAKNLNGAGIRVEVDYQLDERIGEDGYANWINLELFTHSPEDTVDVGAACTQFRYRLRFADRRCHSPARCSGYCAKWTRKGMFKVDMDVHGAGGVVRPNVAALTVTSLTAG